VEYRWGPLRWKMVGKFFVVFSSWLWWRNGLPEFSKGGWLD
jgi:hypothetical protein